MIYDFHCPVTDVVHPLHPQHLILCFELFCDALTLGYLLYQQEHFFLSLFIDVGKVGIQSAAGQKLRVQGFSLRLDVPQVPSSPNADRSFILGRYYQAWDIIVTLHFVPQTVALIKNILFHCEILLYNCVVDPSIRVLAQESTLEIARTRLGNRTIDAVMVPCKDTATINGMEVFVDTPSEVQRRRYLEYVRDELAEQDAKRQDGRCNIPDAYGGLKWCPCRVPNPDYVVGGNQPKTLPVRCEGCVYEPFKQAHTTVVLSALDSVNEDGEMQTFEIPAPKDLLTADRFLVLREEFIAFVRERNPKLVPLAELLTLEFTKSEAARELGDAWSTVTSRSEKLKALVPAFLETVVTL